MKKILATLAFVSIAITGAAQNITKPGLYNRYGEVVRLDAEPVVVNTTLHVVVKHFTPGIYARYAQKYLGQRAQLSESTTMELKDGRLALGEAKSQIQTIEPKPYTLPLPLNKMSATPQTLEEAASATAEMIFSLRRHRLDLITGEAGENVFGAGLQNALEEIANMEKSCLEMFYGSETITEEIHTFNIEITPDKTDYVVCRFSDNTGVLKADDLSGKPVVIKVVTTYASDVTEEQSENTGKKRSAASYIYVPLSKCSLLSETELLDTISFASVLFAK